MAPNGHLAQCCGSVDQPPHFINIMKVRHYNVEYEDVTKKCCCDCIISLLERLTIMDLPYEPVPIITHIESYENDMTAALETGLVVKVNDHTAFAKEHKQVILQMGYPNSEECSVCLDKMKNQVVAHTPCGHRFHSKCLSMCREYKKDASCPLCRSALTEAQMIDSSDNSDDDVPPLIDDDVPPLIDDDDEEYQIEVEIEVEIEVATQYLNGIQRGEVALDELPVNLPMLLGLSQQHNLFGVASLLESLANRSAQTQEELILRREDDFDGYRPLGTTLHNPQSFVDDDAQMDSIAEEWIGYWGGIEANDNDHYEV